MQKTRTIATARAASSRGSLCSIRHQIANTLVGRTVDLLADTSTIVHGVVTGVLNDAGCEKLVVGGAEYEMTRLLTVTPTGLL